MDTSTTCTTDDKLKIYFEVKNEERRHITLTWEYKLLLSYVIETATTELAFFLLNVLVKGNTVPKWRQT